MNQKQKNSMKAVILGLLLFVGAMPGEAQYSYTTNSDEVSLTITSYNGPGGNVSIPTNINGLAITAIGTNAFTMRTDVTGVTIPDGITIHGVLSNAA